MKKEQIAEKVKMVIKYVRSLDKTSPGAGKAELDLLLKHRAINPAHYDSILQAIENPDADINIVFEEPANQTTGETVQHGENIDGAFMIVRKNGASGHDLTATFEITTFRHLSHEFDKELFDLVNKHANKPIVYPTRIIRSEPKE